MPGRDIPLPLGERRAARDAEGNYWMQHGGEHPHRQTEREFQDAVVELARLTGWRVYHTYDSRRSEAGYPDLTLAKGGSVIFAELKRDAKARVTRDQRAWLEALAPRGSIGAQHAVYVWRPSDWPEIERILTGGLAL